MFSRVVRTKKAFLVRLLETEKATLGLLHIRGKEFYTLENHWEDNKKYISRIPQGTYSMDYVGRSASGRFRKVWWIPDVPERSEVLIHVGNYHTDTHGCILLGLDYHVLPDGTPTVVSSQTALDYLAEYKGKYQLKITNEHMLGNFSQPEDSAFYKDISRAVDHHG